MSSETSDEKYQRAVDAEMRAKLAAQAEGPVASPSVPYIRYIMQDEYVPDDFPESLRAVVYDKEFALSNLKDEEIVWSRTNLIRSEIMFKNSRPALACNYREEIMLSALPVKHLIKLARSRDGGFERRQQTTQTVIKRVETGGAAPVTVKRSRWRFLGRGKKE